MPEKAFQILRDGNVCTIEFFDNVKSQPTIDGFTGKEIPSWDYDRYELQTQYSPNLFANIESDFASWLQKAKDAELAAEEEKVRNFRDGLLNSVDTKYCNSEKWANMTEAQHTEWKTYKQALRDVPTQAGFPYAVNWPALPADAEV